MATHLTIWVMGCELDRPRGRPKPTLQDSSRSLDGWKDKSTIEQPRKYIVHDPQTLGFLLDERLFVSAALEWQLDNSKVGSTSSTGAK